jgi:hypothetical protein
VGAILLIFPQVPRRWKEWAYAGFAFDFVFASMAYAAVEGLGTFSTYFPLVFLALLLTSYVCLDRISRGHQSQTAAANQGRSLSL